MCKVNVKMLPLQHDSACRMLYKGGKRLQWGHNAELGSQDTSFPLILFVTVKSQQLQRLSQWVFFVCVYSTDDAAPIMIAPQHYTTKLLRGEEKHNFSN